MARNDIASSHNDFGESIKPSGFASNICAALMNASAELRFLMLDIDVDSFTPFFDTATPS